MVDENRFGVLIADVSGHGVPAALGASMVKIAVPHAADPALVLAICGTVRPAIRRYSAATRKLGS